MTPTDSHQHNGQYQLKLLKQAKDGKSDKYPGSRPFLAILRIGSRFWIECETRTLLRLAATVRPSAVILVLITLPAADAKLDQLLTSR
ncbi:hypothetical protein [Caballeronia cordobensis]|uniref:hypothetical protein n=1 Tax=Caballeronia cordobensis TaxID=1353886 RepID=UPI00128EB318|nr:hypothetical protein [Caballeronia cordobensis]